MDLLTAAASLALLEMETEQRALARVKALLNRKPKPRLEHRWVVASVPQTNAAKAALRRDKQRLEDQGFKYVAWLSGGGNVVVEAHREVTA